MTSAGLLAGVGKGHLAAMVVLTGSDKNHQWMLKLGKGEEGF